MDKSEDYEKLMLNMELENIFFNTITDIDNIIKIVYNINSIDILIVLKNKMYNLKPVLYDEINKLYLNLKNSGTIYKIDVLYLLFFKFKLKIFQSNKDNK